MLLPLVDPINPLALAMSPCSVQFVPFQTSVMPTAPDPGSPPKATHAVLSDPAPPRLRRAVFKLFTAVHVEPFQLSVPAKYSGDPPLSLNPPNANAEVVIPPAPPSFP